MAVLEMPEEEIAVVFGSHLDMPAADTSACTLAHRAYR
jgi:hypothetical protein